MAVSYKVGLTLKSRTYFGVLGFLDVIIFMAMTFVGNYVIYDIPAFYIVWLALVLYRYVTGLTYTKIEYGSQLTATIILFPIILSNVPAPSLYTNTFFMVIMYINVMPILSRVLSIRHIVNPAWLIIIVLLPISLLNISSGIERNFIVFGPNVLYRIYGVCFLLGFLIESRKGKIILGKLFIVLAALFINITATGSRGGFLVYILCLGYALFVLRSRKAVFLSLCFTVGFIVLALVVYWDVVEVFIWRLIYFDQSNNSEAGRLYYYAQLSKFFDEGGGNLIFGLGDNNHIYKFYPHNLLLETLVFNGLYTLFLVLSLMLLWFYSIISKYKQLGLIIFLPILLGSLLSGSMFDNYTFVSAGFYMLGAIFINKNININIGNINEK